MTGASPRRFFGGPPAGPEMTVLTPGLSGRARIGWSKENCSRSASSPKYRHPVARRKSACVVFSLDGLTKLDLNRVTHADPLQHSPKTSVAFTHSWYTCNAAWRGHSFGLGRTGSGRGRCSFADKDAAKFLEFKAPQSQVFSPFSNRQIG